MDTERSSESLGPVSDQSTTSQATTADSTSFGTPSTVSPSVSGVASSKGLRADAKPFVPPAVPTVFQQPVSVAPQSISILPPPRYPALAPSITISPAHYDEEGNVVYPARVCTTQDPTVQRMIAARDYQLGFRARRSKNAPIAPQLAGSAQFAVFMKGAPQPTAQDVTHRGSDPSAQVQQAAPSSHAEYNPLAETVLGGSKDDDSTAVVDPFVDAEKLLREFRDDDDDFASGSEDDIVVMQDANPLATIAAAFAEGDATSIAAPEPVPPPAATPPATQPPQTVTPPSVAVAPHSLLPPPPLPTDAPQTQQTQQTQHSLQATARPWDVAAWRGGRGGAGGRRGGHFNPSDPVVVPLHLEPPPYAANGSLLAPPLYAGAIPPPPPTGLPPTTTSSGSGAPLLSMKPALPTGANGRGAPMWDEARAPGPARRLEPQGAEKSSVALIPEDSQPVPSTLKVNADTFFSETAPQPADDAPTKALPNPFSLQSLQGVRRAEASMPLVQVVWQKVVMQGSETWVPPPFLALPDEVVRLHNGAKHYDVSRPLTHPNVSLHLYQYRCNSCPIDVYPGKINERPADVKLGGICGDVPALCIAHLVEVITKVKILAVDIFGNNLGRCNLWLQNPAQVPELTAKFDRRMWMSPVAHGYAILAPDDDAREYLLWYLESLRAYGPKFVRFPRHLVTCEKWIA